jgi:hypothetical protein
VITGIVVALPEELATLTSKKMAKGRCVFMAENVIVAFQVPALSMQRRQLNYSLLKVLPG